MLKSAIFFVVAMLLAQFTPALAQTEFVTGKELLQQGRTQAALIALQTAVTKSPKNADPWFWLGEAYLRSGKPDSAEFAAEKILALDKKLAAGYLLSAKANLARQNLSVAKERLRIGLKYNKKNFMMLMLLGQALVAGDSLDKAIVAYTRAKLLEPKNPAIYEALGDAYLKQPGGTVIAALHYEQAAELDSLRADLQYKLAKTYYAQRRYNDAARAYRKVVQHDTTNHAALFDLAKLYFDARQFSNAATFLRTYVRRNPDSAKAWSMYLEALYFSGQYDKVLEAAPQVLKFAPDSTNALKMLAHAHFERREYEQAIATYQRLGQKEALPIDDLKRLGQAYTVTKRDSLAALTLEEAAQMDTSDAEVYGDLGVVYMRRQQFDKAAAAFEKRFTLDSTAVSAYINYALSNMALSKWDLARVALVRALRLKPDYLKGHLYLARCYTQMDSLMQAKRACETLVQLAGNDDATYKDELAEAHGIIGFAWLLDKSYPEALAALNASIKLVDNNAQTRLWRAQTLALSGRIEEAIEEYETVLKLDPQNQTAKKDLKSLAQK